VKSQNAKLVVFEVAAKGGRSLPAKPTRTGGEADYMPLQDRTIDPKSSLVLFSEPHRRVLPIPSRDAAARRSNIGPPESAGISATPPSGEWRLGEPGRPVSRSPAC
jgi:hypothetical protein